ncbi:ATPase [Paenibacillus sp. MMO-58]|uniref:ATPase n=1 Tax=Paenibacillus sp. MMO-58 TaxID=3081290 RepID=UPI003015E15C
MAVVKFMQLALINYAGIRQVQVNYSNFVQLIGQNGEGKSSIGGAPVWILWGKDLNGADYTKDKYSPRPTNYEYDRVFASILLTVDGNEYKFAREIIGPTNNFYVNDIPKKAKEFDAAVAALISQDEFMTVYYPAYFFGLSWQKQRELMMKGAKAPLNKTVLKGIEKLYADKLEVLLKKHSIADLEAKYKQDKPRQEKEYNQAVGATSKVREMLNSLPAPEGDLETMEAAVVAAREAFQKEDQVRAEAWAINNRYYQLLSEYNHAADLVEKSKERWPEVKNREIADTCHMCRQPLQGEALQAVQDNKQKAIESYQAGHKLLVDRKKAAAEALAGVEEIDITEQNAKAKALEDKYEELLTPLMAMKRYEQMKAELDKSAEAEKTALEAFKESTLILDAIKAFKAKEAELQAAEIESKFTRLSVRLFKYIKTNDAYEPDFSIQYDGKDYAYLSTGERIAAGLELAEVLHNQTGLIAPVFIDHIGEYTGNIVAYDQVITARAVPDQTLQIETIGGQK